MVFITELQPLSFQTYLITKNEQKTKRNTKTQKNQRKNDFYTNLNDYWMKKTPVDIKNLDEKDAICDKNLESKDKNLDFDVFKDKNDGISEDILQLEKIIREAKRNMEKEPRENLAKKLNYPSLNDEEMRMLSDEPAVVNMIEDIYIENEVRLKKKTKKNFFLHFFIF